MADYTMNGAERRNPPMSSEPAARFGLIARSAGLLVVAIGGVCLLGWTFGVAQLKSDLPGLGAQRPLTGLLLALAGAAVFCSAPGSGSRRARIGRLLAILVVVIGAAVLCEYVVGSLGIDQLLWHDHAKPYPGRPAGRLAGAMITFGIACACTRSERVPGWVIESLSALTAAVAVLALAGQLFGVVWLRGGGDGAGGIAVQALTGLVLLSIGLVALRPHAGLAALLSGDDPGGRAARALVPAALIGPLALGAMRLTLEKDGLDRRVGASIFTLTMIALIFSIVVWVAMRLRSSDAGLRRQASIVESSAIAVFATVGTTISEWNAAAERMFGYPATEVIGRPITILASSEEAWANLRHEMHASLLSDRTPSIETVCRHRTGALIDVAVTFSPLHDPAGRVTGAAGFARDITERKRAQAALQTAESLFRGLLEAAPDGLVIVDTDGRIVLVNERTEALFGFPRSELIGQHVEVLLPDAMGARHRTHRTRFAGRPRTRQMGAGMDLIAHRRDGTTFPVEISLSPMQTDDGMLVTAAIRDVSERRRDEQEISRLAAIVESSVDAIISNTLDGTITSWNPAAEAMFGYTAHEAIGRSVAMLHAEPAQTAALQQNLERVKTGATIDEFETLRRTKSGHVLDVSMVVSPIRNAGGEVIGSSAMIRDISDRRRVAMALAQAQAQFRAAFENAPVGVAIVGISGSGRGRIVHANAALARMVGRDPGQLDGYSIDELTHPDDKGRTDSTYDRLDLGETVELEKRYRHADGRTIWVLISSTPLPTPDGSPPTLAVKQVLDISERKRLERQLRHLADHDALTGLFNRHRFETELHRVLAESRRHQRSAALLVLDLDGFKQVNDSIGHHAGDELVSKIAELMRRSLRETDVLARLGGDEFAVILQECKPADAIAVAEKILAAVRRQAITIGDEHRAQVTTSVGITTFDHECELSAAELLVEADIAMYDAKEAGKNRYAIYDRDRQGAAATVQRHSWLERIRSALEEDRFVLHAQPIAPICAGGLDRYELLIRLPADGDGELIPPGAFLYNAERFGLIGELDRWVLRQAIELLHRHWRAGNDVALAVNISGKTMNDLALPRDLEAMLAEFPLPPGRLVIEVTETAAILNIDRAREFARELHRLGCRFALDDFGAGFASFSHFKQLEFDYLKIDGEFIHSLAANVTDQLVVRAVVDIARGLGTDTVAEFVGDAATVAMLETLGVGYGQGYFLGPPGPIEETLPALPFEITEPELSPS